MTSLPFHQVDVFCAQPLRGNPLAVVHGAQGVREAAMAEFARWTNLSETCFLLPPTEAEADYRVRIFSPGGELPFAGHPTLGSAHAWLAAGGTPRDANCVVQQCGAGLVRVKRGGEGGRLAFTAPPVRQEPVNAALRREVCQALGLEPHAPLAAAWLSSGFPQLALELESAAAVLALKPDFAALKALAKVGVVGRHPAGAEADLEVRFFAPGIGVPEDPVTGSFNANVARWLIDEGRMPRRYRAAQGRCLGRDGRIEIEDDGDALWVGGQVHTLVEGQVLL